MRIFFSLFLSAVIFALVIGEPYISLLYSYQFWAFVIGVIFLLKSVWGLNSLCQSSFTKSLSYLFWVACLAVIGMTIFSHGFRENFVQYIGLSVFAEKFSHIHAARWQYFIANILTVMSLSIFGFFTSDRSTRHS